MSEGFAKPLFGEGVYGRETAKHVRWRQSGGDRLAILADSGFREEAMELVREFGPLAVRRVILSRPGRDFSNDSRSHWEPIPSVVDYRVENDGDMDELRAKADELVKAMGSWLDGG
jgi:hypothetical protein